jgi:hypothetical protein
VFSANHTDKKEAAMGTRAGFAKFQATHGPMLGALESCVRDLSSNQPTNSLRGYTFDQVAIYQSNPDSASFGVTEPKVLSQGARATSTLGRGAVNAFSAGVPFGARLGIGAVATGLNIPQNVAVTIPLNVPGLLPNGVKLGFGPIGGAVGPWIAAGTIMHKFRTVNGKSLSDLHDFYPDGDTAYCTNPGCRFAPAHELGWGMGKSDRKWKVCEDSCWYFADANDCLAGTTAVKIFLGAITAGILPKAYDIGVKVKNAVDKRRRFKTLKRAGARFLTPQVGAKWEPDANKCSCCDTEIGSVLNIFKRRGRSSSRHHCRLCGKNYCGEHCSIKVPMIAPLQPGHHVTSESHRRVNGNKSFINEYFGTTPVLELICAPCVRDVKLTAGKVTQVDYSEKTEKARVLIECARNGCPRAQAALLVAFRNGANVLDAVKATFVYDGATVLANKLLGS